MDDAGGTECVCHEPLGHEGRHKCRDVNMCAGEWHYEEDGKFVVDQWPLASMLDRDPSFFVRMFGAD